MKAVYCLRTGDCKCLVGNCVNCAAEPSTIKAEWYESISFPPNVMVRNGFLPSTWFTEIGRIFLNETKIGINIVRGIPHFIASRL